MNMSTVWTVRMKQRERGRPLNNCIEFDLSKDIKESMRDLLSSLCRRNEVSRVHKVGHLNGFVKFIRDSEATDYGYSKDELFRCIRLCMLDQTMQIRAATLRMLHHLINTEQDVLMMNKLQYGYFVARSLDLLSRDDVERLHALRLARKVLVTAPKHFSPAIVRSLVSNVNAGLETNDNLFRAFLATLCELSILNEDLFISCGGATAVARVAATNQPPHIAEATVGVLIRLLSFPETRSHVSLLCIAAPYCELEPINQTGRSEEERSEAYAASKWAVLSVLRSFAGVMHFCHPNENSGIKAIVDILYIDQLQVRGAVLELFYELLGLPLPTWTDEPDVALAAVDPRRFRDTWKLDAGFVEAEGRIILPPISSSPNLTEQHLALLVYVLIEVGLHRALAEIIVCSDTFISVRAAVLLGALLHLVHSLLPSKICDVTPPLPNLLQYASSDGSHKHQAWVAMMILNRMQTMMRSRPTPASLFMDRLLQAGAWLRPSIQRDLRRHSNVRHWLKRESPMLLMLRDSQVLNVKDAHYWNWPSIRSLLRSRDESFMSLQDNDHRTFIKKLIKYFRPSSNAYSRIELTTNALKAREITLAGCDLINLLLEMYELEGERYLNELINDVAENIMALRMSNSAHNVLFSPRSVTITCCQKYFLFIGQLSHSARGVEVLRSYQLFDKLQDLAVTTKHQCYVKLVVSSLDYLREGLSRRVLAKVANDASSESTRLYATRFLRILLRARKRDADHWVIMLLLNKLNDTSPAVANAALEALHEACEEPELLEVVLQKSEQNILKNWNKWMVKLGNRGHLLKIRFYSLRSAFASLPSAAEELEKWIKPGGLAEYYAGLLETAINDSLTRRQRSESGCYQKRTSDEETVFTTKDMIVPPHLIGQFVQHEFGIQQLIRRNVLQRFARTLQRFKNEYTSSGLKESGGTREDGRSEDKKTEGMETSSRLKTIVDAEITEKPQETSIPRRSESTHVEVKRKLSQDDSRRTTPEKSWRSQPDSREDSNFGELYARLKKVKAALWALGHAGTSAMGVEQLCNLGIIELICSIAESCPYFGVRAVAIYSLSIVGSCRAGANALATHDWSCVTHKRGMLWPILQSTSTFNIPHQFPTFRQPSPSLLQQQQQQQQQHHHQQWLLGQQSRHQRSLSDGRPELPDVPTVIRRQRNQSESAATDYESRRLYLPDRGDTPSPIPSSQRFSQQDIEGLTKLRSLQRYRRPSYSPSSGEHVHSQEDRLSLQSLSEYESVRSWNESIIPSTPSHPIYKYNQTTMSASLTSSQDSSNDGNERYVGIALPRKLTQIFPDATPSDVLFDKPSDKNRQVYQTRLAQEIHSGEVSLLHEDLRYVNRLLQVEKPQAASDSERCASPIPAIVLEEGAHASSEEAVTATFTKLSVTESFASEIPSTSNQLMLPKGKTKHQRTSSTSRDGDYESSSEYEINTDHSRICLVCFRERSVSDDSVTGSEVDFRKSLDKPRKDVLKHTQQLANPVFHKESRQSLLMLRQQYPAVFEDECMYSEVAAHLASNMYRIQARRFLQELFLDSSFDKLYEEISAILKLNTSESKDGQSSHVPSVAVIVTPLRKSYDVKVNGRPIDCFERESRKSPGNKEDSTRSTQSRLSSCSTVNPRKSSDASLQQPAKQRLSDEKIIAEILKPEERIRVPKSSEKILKARSSINTAISLE
ncbi:rapamycin-insensitive companion of mTOR-like [Copidosoma floridanum]|uniref:rapamycin-insensitive companion of mTOR-like n=1 Tax=Copidosoma floridanum TaxID=29053 RepID=UPI0006C98898|nr:rapamycin-insensitive companion of mTOR-like [Copidosoma floridanum]